MTRTVVIDAGTVANRIERALPGIIMEVEGDAVVVNADAVVQAALFLRDDDELDCKFLNCLTAVDMITHFDVVYHLSSLAKNHTLIIKARSLNHEIPVFPSVAPVWMGAHLQEREAYDLMGILFSGHPNMKRIFLWEGFPGHPLRKDFLALPGGFKPGLQRFPFEFPQGQRNYGSLQNTESPVAPRVPRLDYNQDELPIDDPEPVKELVAPAEPEVLEKVPTGAGADPAQAGGTAANPVDSIDRAHSGPGEAIEGRGRAAEQGGPGEAQS